MGLQLSEVSSCHTSRDREGESDRKDMHGRSRSSCGTVTSRGAPTKHGCGAEVAPAACRMTSPSHESVRVRVTQNFQRDER